MRFIRPNALLAGSWPNLALCVALTGCVPATTEEPAAPAAQPQLAYTPRSGGVATEANYKRDRNKGPKDDVAERKIETAVNELYLMGKMREAEAQLKGVYEACGDDCSPRVKAKAWMYIGIVWGSGNNDAKKAREAFRYALELDPTTRLDVSLATPETKKVFDEEKSAVPVQSAPGGSPPPTAPPPGGVPPTAPAPAPASTRPGQPGVPIAPPPPPATR